MPTYFAGGGLASWRAGLVRPLGFVQPSETAPASGRLGVTVSAFLALCAAACTSGPSAPTPGEQDFATYESLPHYRAFAITGGTLSSKLYIDGWTTAASSIDGATAEAVRQCASRQAGSPLPACELYAIGNIVVSGASPAQIEQAKCMYILDPLAASLKEPAASQCAAMKTVRLTLPADEGSPAPGEAVLMTQLEAGVDGGSRGEVVRAQLSGPADPSAPSVALLTAEAIRDQLAGNTLAVPGSSYIYLREDGLAVLRSSDPSFGWGTGSWRVNGDGYYCARWPKIERGNEVCRPIVEAGGAYAIGDLSVTVIKGNAFGL